MRIRYVRTCVPTVYRVKTVTVRPHVRITANGVRLVKYHLRSKPCR